MLQIVYTARMKQDAKRVKKRGKDISKLIAALDLLARKTVLPKSMRDHALKGGLQNFRECHIEPDWLLIYRIFEDELILLASGTDTHADLFEE